MNIELMNKLLKDPSISYWLKDAMKALYQRDVNDATADARLLAQCFNVKGV
jgi:hypothetical protein